MNRQRSLRACVAFSPMLILTFGGTLLVAGQVQDVSRGWASSGMRRLAVAAVRASSTFAPEGGRYAPARVADRNRGTKWVASIAPSRTAPQWITLELFGEQEVSAVAVFGNPVDNDGILDARVQVAGGQPDQYTTVATIGEAKSAAWLARFDPVKTRAVRLLVTRSGGPSSHTDVQEIEVYGRPLSAARLHEYGAKRLSGCTARWTEVAAAMEKLDKRIDPRFAGFSGAVDSLQRRRQQLAELFARWDTLDESTRQPLVTDLERLEVSIQRLIQGLDRVAAVWPDRARDLAGARQAAGQAAAGENVVSLRKDGKLRLGNSRVSVVLNEKDGTWDATWLDGIDAAVRRVHWAVDVNGRTFQPAGVKAEVVPVSDAIGGGLEIRQRWGEGIEIQRRIRLYHGRPAVLVSGRVTNNTGGEAKLGNAKMLELSDGDRGWWHLAGLLRAPAAVGYSGASPACRPAPDEEALAEAGQRYGSAGVLGLSPQESPAGLALGFLSARAGSPFVDARFRAGEGGTSLGANLSTAGRVLPVGGTIDLDPVWLAVEENRHGALEHFGDAVAALASPPVRTGANALWCSWYPIRMGISEQIALAQAAIIAKHFKPLGLDVVQLDHGWQRGDVCGDWVPNERFPHGLKWLAEELKSRHGLKLGLWIAPTQVAATSQLFREHPEWMVKDARGRPAVGSRWFWVPHPEMMTLDASLPEAEKWIEETFARLSAEGAAYYKIDFIAGSRALGRAMGAIRRGAGPEAWIRYCQTPPLLSAGLASSAYIGADTGDAGLAGWINLQRKNAPLLAASYWVNDRLYHREICDMSVGMKADVEEARFRLALMTLGGCSSSFSDDLRPLKSTRIRMMQQCLPPGNPTARPLDLFERELPSLWHVHCKNGAGEWEVVGLFNFEDQPRRRAVELAALGLPTGTEVVAFEFWEERFLGTHKERIALSLAPRTARILLIHRRPTRPQVIATNLHVLGGYHEIKHQSWDKKQLVLSGRYERAPGLAGKAYLYVPDGYRPRPDSSPARGAGSLANVEARLWAQAVEFQEASFDWKIEFARPDG